MICGIVEMTTGMIVLCMPSTAAIIKLVYSHISIAMPEYSGRLRGRKTHSTTLQQYPMNEDKGASEKRSSKKYRRTDNSEKAIVHEIV